MQQFTDLTAEQQRALSNYATMLRPLAGEMARIMNRMEATVLAYEVSVRETLETLEPDSVITDGTSLAGAVPLNRTDFETITGYCAHVLELFNDAERKQQLCRACGAANMIG